MADWNKRFIELTQLVASWSKDKRRKVGAVIVDADRRVIATGYNGIPKGCDDEDDSRYAKPKKLLFFAHAEANAIYYCAKSGVRTKDTTMYVTLHPCSGCCKAIIQSGVIKVICPEPDFEDESWGEEFKAAREMFKEAGVEVLYME